MRIEPPSPISSTPRSGAEANTARTEAAQPLPAASEALLHLLLNEQTRAGYSFSPASGQFEWHNHAASGVLGALPSCEAAWRERICPEDKPVVLNHWQNLLEDGIDFDLRYRLLLSSGAPLRVRHRASAVARGEQKPSLLVGYLEPAEAVVPAPDSGDSLFHIEHYYPVSFSLALQGVIDIIQDNGSSGALLIATLNNLAMVVNAYGHQSTEEIIAQLHGALAEILPAESTIERIHRDQFGIIVSPCTVEEVALHVRNVNDTIRHFGTRTRISGVHLTATVASVDFPGTAATAMDVLDAAYVALRNGTVSQHSSLDTIKGEAARNRQQMGLASYLRTAISEHRLRLAYQPVIESRTGAIGHYEALLRVVGEDGKISSAGALVPIAERMDLIDIIDLEVLDLVVAELVTFPSLTLALNVSNLTTDNPAWMDRITHLLKDKPSVAARLIVEITETAAQRDLRRTAYFVAAVQALGCQVALDDFGSGYTSFRQLKALSVDMIKIDGAFVKDLVDNADNRFFVKTLLDFTNGFGLRSVAEFVENGETAKMLMELGVEYMQGYYFGRPLNHRSWLSQGEYGNS